MNIECAFGIADSVHVRERMSLKWHDQKIWCTCAVFTSYFVIRGDELQCVLRLSQ